MSQLSTKLAEQLTKIKSERNILIPNSMDEACERYVKDIRFILDRDIKHDKPVLMLSGGVDSMLLGCVLKKYYGLTRAITCGSAKDTGDILVSQDSAEQLGIEQEMVFVTWDEVIDNLPLCRGHDIATVFDLVYYLTFYLCMKKANVKNTDLIQGDGADTLLGSIQSFMYMETGRTREYFNVSKSTAKTLIKQNFYNNVLLHPERRWGAGHLFVDAANELEANPIMVFKNPDIIRWVNDLDFDFANPNTKLFPKETIRYLGYDPKKVKRTVMQQGTGLYEKMKEHMMQITGAKSPNGAVKQYMNTDEMPLPGYE